MPPVNVIVRIATISRVDTWCSFTNYPQIFAKEETITLVAQINGKVRDKIEVAAGLSNDELGSIALSSDKIKNWTQNKELRKVIVVKGKLVNIVL